MLVDYGLFWKLVKTAKKLEVTVVMSIYYGISHWCMCFLTDSFFEGWKIVLKEKKLGFLIYENLKKSQFQILLNLLYDL